jgi:hypothetical protein
VCGLTSLDAIELDKMSHGYPLNKQGFIEFGQKIQQQQQCCVMAHTNPQLSLVNW